MSKSDALIRAIPWVLERRVLVSCDGIVWSRATRQYITRAPNGRVIPAPRAACPNPARWHFTALPKSWAYSGDYCWHYLMSQCLFADMDEDDRLEGWMRDHPETIRAARPDLYAEEPRWDDLP